ncbi:MAG: hypothetical protein GF381_02900 [Candidatus Pacebacteria bacterium]|nr:hypothetical protein [Candidatus Paceibacterota bacterium]
MHKLSLDPQTPNSALKKEAFKKEAHEIKTAKQKQAGLDEKTALSQNQDSGSGNSTQSTQVAPSRINDSTDRGDMTQKNKKILLIISLIAILGGAATGVGGYQLRMKTSANKQKQEIAQVSEGALKKGDVFGLESDLFKDKVTGYLQKGGIEGEGSHHLLREGGPSQTVYLTSSTIDLDKLVGAEVKIWGETNKGQVAAWLMDAGKVEVLNPDAEPPFEQEL